MATEPNIISPSITTSDEHLEPWRGEEKRCFECVGMHVHDCQKVNTSCMDVSVYVCYLEAEALLLGFLGFGGAGGGAVQGTAAASCRT